MTKIPRCENTLLQLNENTKIERDYPTFNDDIALFYLKSTNLKYIIYVKELKKSGNIWVGNAYSYKEAYEKNSGFKWLEDDSKSFNPEYNREQKEIEYNKSTGYFIIDDKKEIYGLSEEETKKILNISSLNLKNPEKYIKKNNVKVIFFETLTSDKVSKTIASETGAKTDVLNPVEGLTKEEMDAGKDYLSIMEENLKALEKSFK
ncbi:MAG: metal ABC transporter solute-binding protein, Zn/Mn family [Fusobacterium polymorphum]